MLQAEIEQENASSPQLQCILGPVKWKLAYYLKMHFRIAPMCLHPVPKPKENAICLQYVLLKGLKYFSNLNYSP